jgi:hypothetical protein
MPTYKVNIFRSGSSPPRPKSSNRQSIRGKISAPIPMPNPNEDEEFPIRKPGTSFAAPKEPSDDEFPIRRPGQAQRVSTIPPPEDEEAEQSGHQAHVSDTGQSNVPERPQYTPPAPPDGPSPSSGTGGPGTSPSQRRTNPSSTLRFSQISAASTGHTGHSGDRPQRKKSTLRNALSRIFGRRKKGGSQGSVSTDRMSGLAGNQHRSVSRDSYVSAVMVLTKGWISGYIGPGQRKTERAQEICIPPHNGI